MLSIENLTTFIFGKVLHNRGILSQNMDKHDVP